MSNAPSSSSLEGRLDHIQRELDTLRRRLTGRTRISIVLAVIVIAALSVYFYLGYTGFGEITQPNMLVSLLDQHLDDNLPRVRQTLQEYTISESPRWAEQFSAEVQSSLPAARQELENYIVDQMVVLLDETHKLTEEQFRGFLIENRAVLEQGFQELSSSPKMAEATMNEIIAGLDKQLSREIQADANQLFETLSMMNAKLEKLKSGKGLNPEQQLERQVLMLTRRLQLEHVEPDPALRATAMSGASPVVAPVAPPQTPLDAEPAADTESDGKSAPEPDSAGEDDDAAGDADSDNKGESEGAEPSGETDSPPEGE